MTRPMNMLIIDGSQERYKAHTRHDKKVIMPHKGGAISSMSAALQAIATAITINTIFK